MRAGAEVVTRFVVFMAVGEGNSRHGGRPILFLHASNMGIAEEICQLWSVSLSIRFGFGIS